MIYDIGYILNNLIPQYHQWKICLTTDQVK